MTASPRQKAMFLYCGTGRQNQLFKCKDVTVGNMMNKHLEDSPSNDGWNSFKRQVEADTNYLDTLEFSAVPTLSFNKMVPFHAGALQ
jgi:hypothetical protein